MNVENPEVINDIVDSCFEDVKEYIKPIRHIMHEVIEEKNIFIENLPYELKKSPVWKYYRVEPEEITALEIRLFIEGSNPNFNIIKELVLCDYLNIDLDYSWSFHCYMEGRGNRKLRAFLIPDGNYSLYPFNYGFGSSCPLC